MDVYIPSGRWYDFHTGEVLFSSGSSTGFVTRPAPTDGDVPLLVRAGKIIPRKEPGAKNTAKRQERETHIRVYILYRVRQMHLSSAGIGS